MEEIKKDIDEARENTTVFLEMVKDQRRTSEWQRRVIAFGGIIAGIIIAAIVGMFLWFLSLYDYTSVEETQYDYQYEVDGIYAVVDSDGNVIAQDVPPEVWEMFLSWREMNGND